MSEKDSTHCITKNSLQRNGLYGISANEYSKITYYLIKNITQSGLYPL